jgi:proline racemase
MRTSLACLVTTAALTVTACAHDVTTAYPARGAPMAGTLVVELTRPAEDLTVSVGGALVARHAHSQRVVVTGVPAGPIDVDVAFGGGWYARAEHHQTVEVVPGAETAIVVPGPERSLAGAVESAGTWIYLGLIYAALLGATA